MRDLTKQEIKAFFDGKCPQCGKSAGWYEGGAGGMSQNLECANDECQAQLNIMGTDPSVNLGGQLIQPSKLGDAFRGVIEVPPAPKRPWWKLGIFA